MILCTENYPTIIGHEPVASNLLVDTSDAIRLTNANGCLITILEDYAVAANQLVLTVHEGQTAAAAALGTLAIATAWPIWSNLDCATSDTMVRRADAITYTLTGVGAGDLCIVQFYIPAAILTATYDWIALGSAAGDAGNLVSVLYQLDGARYQQETPPTAIV